MEQKVGLSTRICFVCYNKIYTFTQFKENVKKIAVDLEKKYSSDLETCNVAIKKEIVDVLIEEPEEPLEMKVTNENFVKEEDESETDNDSIHYCKYCNKTIESEKSASKYLTDFLFADPKSNIDKQIFTERHRYKCTKRLATLKGRVKCSYCRQTYASKKSLGKHLETCKYKAEERQKPKMSLIELGGALCPYCSIEYPSSSE